MESNVFTQHFRRGGVIPTTADGGEWLGVRTGTLTAANLAFSGGEVVMTMTNTSEVQNICFHQGDVLGFDPNEIDWVEFDVRVPVTPGANSKFAIGLASARNADFDAITHSVFFSLAANSNVWRCECDDNVTDTAAVSTGIAALAGSQSQTLAMHFVEQPNTIAPPGRPQGRFSNINFYISTNNALRRVASTTLFNAAAIATSGQKLQLFSQISKTSSTDVGTVAIREIRYRYRNLTGS